MMNRPKYSVQYGQRSGKNLMFLQYVELLEKYCDYLEKYKEKQFNSGFNEATKICSEKIIALENALDKACEYLAKTSNCEYNECDLPMCKDVCYRDVSGTKIPMFKDDYCYQCNDKDVWKEWLLKDEQIR